VSAVTAVVPLVGPGGEAVDLRRTIRSHGLATLPPTRVAVDGGSLLATLGGDGRPARTVRIAPGRPGFVRAEAVGWRASSRRALVADAVHLLRLDEDLSGFYAVAAGDPDLSWVTAGAGRMLRGATVFEEVVKTICTTNTTWSATERMVSALVEQLGERAGDGRPAFPTPAAMAARDEAFYAGTVRAGYRGRYLLALARSVAEGGVELEALRRADGLGDDEVAVRLLALPGVGPYGAAHVMMLLGRYSRLVLDSWTRPTYARLVGRDRVADPEIAERFARYGHHAGLAFWLFLTRHWVPEPARR
jgi:3-methyladenine DNA glycosylase/8-oxoguanine DNA glycosylase